MNIVFKVYFAGALFNHKDLIGNAQLASHINQHSEGRYQCILPQDLEQTTGKSLDIRNQDLKQVIECDLAIFNFDGTELDSGTVVEFMLAKFLDIPSVIIRSDFRTGGDQDKDGDDWNLMCSFYPRTHKVQFNAMACYQQAVRESDSLNEAMDNLYSKIASILIGGLDLVRKIPPLPKGDKNQEEALYEWALKFLGSDLEKLVSQSALEKLLATKREKGLV